MAEEADICECKHRKRLHETIGNTYLHVNISSAVQCVNNPTAYTNEKSCLNEKHQHLAFVSLI